VLASIDRERAQRDEEVDECVHDEQLYVAREPIPARRTVPVKQQLVDLVQNFLFPRTIVLQLTRVCHPHRGKKAIMHSGLRPVAQLTMNASGLYLGANFG